uniref:Uncharacterized protein n=1 Tax=Sus scrofa TaxID=9823 RepID=A0A8D1U154_PIG
GLSVSQSACIYSVLILQDNEVMEGKIYEKNLEAKKNMRNLMMTWALVFLNKPL